MPSACRTTVECRLPRQAAGARARGPGQVGDGRVRPGCPGPAQRWVGTRARTRVGLPEPPTILRGAAISRAPMGGRRSTLASWVRPYLPAPSRKLWQGKGGSKLWAAPASVPTVSTPMPRMGRSSASQRAQATSIPGVWGPVSSALSKAASSWALADVVLVLAGDPVDGGVEVGAGVLAALQGVPVPGRPALVVVGQLPQPEPGRVGERLGQAQDPALLRQRLGQVEHLDLPGGQGGDQVLDGIGHGVGSPWGSGRRARWNSKRFSSRCRSMWKLAGPTGSTLATRQASSGVSMAATAAARNSSTPVTVAALAMPAARATPARSEPVAVAVGNPPTLSRLWLSNTMWVRFGGA